MRDQMYLHAFNDTDVICFVIHVSNMTQKLFYMGYIKYKSCKNALQIR